MENFFKNRYKDACTLYEGGFYQKAKDIFTNLLLKYPFSFEIWFSLAASYQQLKNYKKAISSFLVALTLSPKNSKIFFHIAQNYLSLKNFEEAFFYLKQAKKYSKDANLIEKIKILENQNFNKKEKKIFI